MGYGLEFDFLERGYEPDSHLGTGKTTLTDTTIRATKPSKRPYKVYDRDGLFLLVNPGGSTASGLFHGQTKEFFSTIQALAAVADAAVRKC